MTAKIEKDFNFESALHFSGKFLINFFEMTLHMSVDTDNELDQNIAIERLNYYILNHVENSLFINKNEVEAIKKYEDAGLTVLTTPEDPYDQIVGLVLMLKLNAILEGRLHIEKITFSSKLAAGIRFNTPFEETEEFNGNYWYTDPSASTKIVKTKNKKEKIVKLFDQDDWASLELIWKEKLPKLNI